MKVRLKAIYDAYPFDGTWGSGRELIQLAPTLLNFRVTDEEQGLGTILVMRRDGGMDEVMAGDWLMRFDERTFGLVKGVNFAAAYEEVSEEPIGAPTSGKKLSRGRSRIKKT
jgi:hypothetical protein